MSGQLLRRAAVVEPENGLFLQYLHAGKVPGAKTVEDVRKFYMDQVPMRKGTGPEDVTKAVLYLIEQTCEAGQARTGHRRSG